MEYKGYRVPEYLTAKKLEEIHGKMENEFVTEFLPPPFCRFQPKRLQLDKAEVLVRKEFCQSQIGCSGCIGYSRNKDILQELIDNPKKLLTIKL